MQSQGDWSLPKVNMDIMEEPQVAMEDIHYRVIYVNRSVSEDRCIQRSARHLDEYVAKTEPDCIADTVKCILEIFPEGLRGR